jgi:6-phosphogluconolactonase
MKGTDVGVDRINPVTRRGLLGHAALGAAWLLSGTTKTAFSAAGAQAQRGGARKGKQMEKSWVYVGTSTGAKSKGIYRFQFDPATGTAGTVALAAESPGPSFLAIHPNRRFLYAVNGVSQFQGQPTGAVSAFAMDTKSGELRLLNQQSSGGSGPCHLVVDAAGKHVLVANYNSGSVASLSVDAEGRLGPPISVIQHAGSSVEPRRQAGPHAHSINLDAANRFAFAADLGLDKILVYRFDAAKGTLTPNDPPAAATAPGAGPRHFAFHPSGRFAYVINELNSTVTAFRYDAAAGVLHQIQAITTLPQGFTGENYPAEVVVHPSGKFLYGSNRGHDSIAVFGIDSDTGKLTPAGHQSSGGKGPRNFALDPSGTWMLIGNQSTDNVLICSVDAAKGTLTPKAEAFASPVPICFKFVPVTG